MYVYVQVLIRQVEVNPFVMGNAFLLAMQMLILNKHFQVCRLGKAKDFGISCGPTFELNQ